MNSIVKFSVLFISLGLVFPLFSADLDKERATILKVDKQWSAAAAEGKDIDLIVSFWSDDAIVFPPGAPAVVGKDSIRRFVQESLATPGFSIDWETTEVVVSPDATLAYSTGKNQTTFNDPEGKQLVVHGKAVAVWRKEPSGEWKCVIDIWNEDPPTGK
jgi:ketosteroid isomerase-like protein